VADEKRIKDRGVAVARGFSPARFVSRDSELLIPEQRRADPI
jgi:hypothetical protein